MIPTAVGNARPRLHHVALIALSLFGGATAALAQDAAKVKAGLEVWKSAGCPDCHGPFADGEKQRDEAPSGANLRTARLDDAALKETIQCGRVNTGMPRFDEDAYAKRGCYGQPAGPVPDSLYPTPRMLSAQEIDSVVIYLRARVIGHRTVTPEDCAFYYEDAASTWCDK
jgi:hypothetical protein